MFTNIDETFTADDVEDFKLHGSYNIKTFYNNHENLKSLEQVPDYHCKAVFYKGNILYKEDEPKILDYINLIIELTYTKHDKKVEKNVEQFNSGTICPSSEVIYEIDDKVFTLYGRYIYGYKDFEKVTFSSKTSEQKIIVERAADAKEEEVFPFLYECSFAFKIVDKKTQVLYAFGLYR